MNPSMNRPSKLPTKSSERLSGHPEPPEQATSQNLESASEVSATVEPESTAIAVDYIRQQPIPPPSEPRQYRAIGLVRGQYMPSADQFTRGTLLAADETLIDAVLLGRVMSLVKNHLDLSQPHLWVVYPRTRQENGNLHVQIVGVWEPEQLSKAESSDLEASTETIGADTSAPVFEDGYFSIRGEVIYQSREQEEGVIVKIKQAPRKDADKPKFFKLKLLGKIAEKAVGHFWDLQVQRDGNSLIVQEATDIGVMPVTKKSKFARNSRPGGGRKPYSQKPYRPGDRPIGGLPPIVERTTPLAPPKRRAEVPKPIKRQAQPSGE